jgi:cytochrome c2
MAFAGVRDETQRRDLIAYLMVESAPEDDDDDGDDD